MKDLIKKWEEYEESIRRAEALGEFDGTTARLLLKNTSLPMFFKWLKNNLDPPL